VNSSNLIMEEAKVPQFADEVVDAGSTEGYVEFCC
jgi:hypothetical protein